MRDQIRLFEKFTTSQDTHKQEVSCLTFFLFFFQGTRFTAEFSESPYSRFKLCMMTKAITLFQYPVGESAKVGDYCDYTL
jgi:hypothetical protein